GPLRGARRQGGHPTLRLDRPPAGRGAGRGRPRPVGPPLLRLRGRPAADPLPLGTPPFDPQLVEHFFQSFATAARLTLHVRSRSGRNTHHIVEACFKGVARCLRDAVRTDGTDVPSTKGTL